MRMIGTVLIVTLLSLPVQAVLQGDGNVIIIRHADSLIGKRIDGETIRELVGNVQLEQEGVLVFCDRAIHFPARNSAFLEGNVRVVDDTVTLHADQGFYDGNARILDGEGNLFLDDRVTQLTAQFGRYYLDERIAEFWENVVVNDPAGIVYSDHLIHRRDDELSTATGNVRVIDRDRGTIIFGQLLEYDSRTGYSVMRESPVLVHTDTTDTGRIDTLIVRSRIMESIQIDTLRRFVAIGDVEMTRADLSARGDTSTYFVDTDELSVTGSPMLWYQENQISGDSIHVTLENRRLRTLEVYERSFVVSRSDERFPDRFNQMTGMSIRMFFKDDKIERVEARDQATSLYFMYEDFIPNGLNHVTGDEITLTFVDGEVHELRIVGGIEAKYYPEILVRGRVERYNLPGFRWMGDDRPALSLPGDLTLYPHLGVHRNER